MSNTPSSVATQSAETLTIPNSTFGDIVKKLRTSKLGFEVRLLSWQEINGQFAGNRRLVAAEQVLEGGKPDFHMDGPGGLNSSEFRVILVDGEAVLPDEIEVFMEQGREIKAALAEKNRELGTLKAVEIPDAGTEAQIGNVKGAIRSILENHFGGLAQSGTDVV